MTGTGSYSSWITWLLALAPLWGIAVYGVWESVIRPRLIPKHDIDALADDLIAIYGPFAEDVAYNAEY